MKRIYLMGSLAMALSLSLFSCTDENSDPSGDDFKPMESDGKYVGEAVGNFSKEEWYPGGELGTTDNVASGCYEDETPAVTAQGLIDDFNAGEKFFERQFTSANSGFKGLGPASVRRSCLDCHPNYGHGRRMDSYTTSYGNGNGYLLAVYHPVDGANSNDGGYVAEVTGMPQTQATEPFKAPIDESQIKMQWHHVTAMESGLPMKFPDGEAYDLIYPEVTIPRSAFRTNPNPYDTGNKAVAVRLESTIGVMGTGLLDAISEDDIKAQYASTANYYKNVAKVANVSEYVNPNFWDASADNFAAGAWYTATKDAGVYADGGNGKPMVKRFTYALTRASLQDGPGANAIWNITNVTRPDRRYHYLSLDGTIYAKSSMEDPDVQAGFPEYIKSIDPNNAHPSWHTADVKQNIYNYLMAKDLDPEMSSSQYKNFMIWHRGLAVPAARNTTTDRFKQGMKLFKEIGCANCHRPSWTTGDDNIQDPNGIFTNNDMPRYPHQKIWPYTDFVQHRLFMENDIRTGWCRTTPLWGRGLSKLCTGAEDRLHDCRARNTMEAIMWHGNAKSDARYAIEKFRKLTKEERDNIVFFVESI